MGSDDRPRLRSLVVLNRFGDFGAQSHLAGGSACPTETQALRANVGQTLSSVNPPISAIVSQIGGTSILDIYIVTRYSESQHICVTLRVRLSSSGCGSLGPGRSRWIFWGDT